MHTRTHAHAPGPPLLPSHLVFVWLQRGSNGDTLHSRLAASPDPLHGGAICHVMNKHEAPWLGGLGSGSCQSPLRRGVGAVTGWGAAPPEGQARCGDGLGHGMVTGPDQEGHSPRQTGAFLKTKQNPEGMVTCGGQSPRSLPPCPCARVPAGQPTPPAPRCSPPPRPHSSGSPLPGPFWAWTPPKPPTWEAPAGQRRGPSSASTSWARHCARHVCWGHCVLSRQSWEPGVMSPIYG